MYARYNYNGATTQSEANLLSDIVKMLSGCTDKTQLNGKLVIGSQAVGITNGSLVVSWAGAYTNITCAVGQGVSGTGIPAGATIASIIDQTSFTLNTSHEATATNAAAILILDETATLPATSIGSTTVAVALASSITVTMTAGTTDIIAVGQKVSGYGIPASTTVATVTANNFTMNNAATVTLSNSTIVIEPAAAVCDTTNTTISTTLNAAGWTVWDSCANAGKYNKVVMRQPLNDDSSNYHYIGLDVATTGFLQIHQYESWNNSTHAATNQTNALGTTKQQRTTVTVAASMMISSSIKHLLLQSNVAAGIGASNKNEWTGAFQRSRISPWDTVANGYPPVVLTCGGDSFLGANTNPSYCPRYKNPSGGDFVTTNATLQCVTKGFSSGITISSGNGGPATVGVVLVKKVPDGVGGFYTPLTDFGFQNADNAFLGGSVSAICDVWLGVAYPLNLDDMGANGKTYEFWQNTNASTTLSSNLAVPKG